LDHFVCSPHYSTVGNAADSLASFGFFAEKADLEFSHRLARYVLAILRSLFGCGWLRQTIIGIKAMRKVFEQQAGDEAARIRQSIWASVLISPVRSYRLTPPSSRRNWPGNLFVRGSGAKVGVQTKGILM
jgi:hypothetical protein